MAIMVAKTIQTSWKIKPSMNTVITGIYSRKIMFLKSASNLISSYPMSWYLIMPKQQLWGFKVSNGKKIIPGEALAFKHLDSEVTTVKVAFFREALIEVLWPRDPPSGPSCGVRESLQEPPLQKIIWGNKFQKKKWGNIGGFFHGKNKNGRCLLKD